jgi:hypothetical protein
MCDLLMELADLLALATDRDPVAAARLADAALAADRADAEAVWTIDLPIEWDGEVGQRRLGLYLGEAPGDEHPDDEGVFFWVHASDVPALIAGKDISGDGWRLAKPDATATAGPAPRTASLLVTVPRTVVVHGTVTYRCTMLTHETDEQIRRRFAADPAAAFQWARSADEVEIEAEHDHASETIECREAEAEVEID